MKSIRAWLVIAALFLPLLALVPDLSADAPAAPQPHTLIKGLAELNGANGVADRAALGVSTFYHWSESCTDGDGTRLAGCVDMVRNWQMPKACYAQLLVGNEPVNQEPAGHPISVHDAVTSTLAIRAMCPNTQLIVANINYGWDWLAQFYAKYKLLAGHEYGTVPHVSGLLDLVGFHIYSNTSANGIMQAQWFMSQAGYRGQFWVTEFRVTDIYDSPGAWKEFALFLKWLGLQPRIDRAYVWTNRSGDWDSLVNANGALNVEGQQYRDWLPAPMVWTLNVPYVKGAAQGYP